MNVKFTEANINMFNKHKKEVTSSEVREMQ